MASVDNGEQDEILQALANLQLPHMPQNLSLEQTTRTPSSPEASELPSIRLLVVADIDLPSSAALAEYCLQQRNQNFDASRIDLCVCCGPFCRDEDALPYLSGKQRLRKINSSLRPSATERAQDQHQHHHQQHHHHNTNGSINSASSSITSSGSTIQSVPQSFRQSPALPTPFARTREETSGLEGLLTASLSQLESIVCRVVYCPGSSDPITSMVADALSSAQASLNHSKRRRSESQRLTPNSRNINRQWLPLAPALGCAGLVYLDSTDVAYRKAFPKRHERRRLSSSKNSASSENASNGDGAHHLSDLSEDDDGSDDEMEMMADQLIKSQQRSRGYIPTLQRLLQLAPPPHNPLLFGRSRSQSILVTHYVDYNQQANDASPANGSPSWAVETPSPWPYGHDEFCDSPITQQLLCLEIASGTSYLRKAETKQRGNIHILFPGSLRARGEFAIVDLAVQPFDKEPSDSSNGKNQEQFKWQVTNVDMLTLHRY